MRLKWQVVFVMVLASSSATLKPQSDSALIQAHYQRAREAIAQHDLQRASQEYAEILRLDPSNASVAAAQGAVLYGLGKPQDAVKVLQRSLSLDPHQSYAEIFLGLSESDLGQCTEAVPLLQKHLSERTEGKLWRMVGLSLLNCYGGSSDLDRALELARSMKQSYPDDPDVLYYLAEVYSRLLSGTVNELLKKHPESYRVHQLAGETLEAAGKTDQALKEYRKALEINPKLSRIHYRIGSLMASESSGPEGDQEALAQFDQELAGNPGDSASEYQVAEIHRKRRRLDDAAKHYLRAVELNPDFAEARVGLAQVYAGQHHLEQAVTELEKAIQAQPDSSTAHYTLMTLYRDLGRSQDAKREMAIFQKLEAAKENDFRSRLRSLLTGEPEGSGRHP